MITIRRIEQNDWPSVWGLIEPVFRAGESYAFPPDISEAEAHRDWAEVPTATYLARNAEGLAVGTYYIKPNHPGPGSHVCNCGYIVAPAARGQGVATRMCEHSQDEARRLGFRAMQFNLVVAENKAAVRLWKGLGFHVVGTLPGAFRFPDGRFVDACVMFKEL